MVVLATPVAFAGELFRLRLPHETFASTGSVVSIPVILDNMSYPGDTDCGFAVQGLFFSVSVPPGLTYLGASLADCALDPATISVDPLFLHVRTLDAGIIVALVATPGTEVPAGSGHAVLRIMFQATEAGSFALDFVDAIDPCCQTQLMVGAQRVRPHFSGGMVTVGGAGPLPAETAMSFPVPDASELIADWISATPGAEAESLGSPDEGTGAGAGPLGGSVAPCDIEFVSTALPTGPNVVTVSGGGTPPFVGCGFDLSPDAFTCHTPTGCP